MDTSSRYEISQEIGDYILKAQLGAGQDGEVWRATREKLGKDFAIKFLTGIEDEDSQDRFEHEIQILATLNHPHIISIVDTGHVFHLRTRKRMPYYVMEFLEAEALNTALQRIPQEERANTLCTLFQQVTSALAKAHKIGISHGDVKSANILVLRHNRIAKLADFGFGLLPGNTARRREEYPGSSYRAPKDLSKEAADIYKLGRTFRDALDELEDSRLSPQREELKNVVEKMIREPGAVSLEREIAWLESIRAFLYQQSLYFAKLRASLPELAPRPKGVAVHDALHDVLILTKRCLGIVDLPDFQRQRRHMEEGLVQLVYPSATHSRFGVALGNYAVALRYLRELRRLRKFQETVEPVHVGALALLSLLAKIGEYPFSSQVTRASSDERYSPEARSASIMRERPMSRVIAADWGLDPEVVASLLRRDEPRDQAPPWSLIRSLLFGHWGVLKAEASLSLSHNSSVPGISDDIGRLASSLRVTQDGSRAAVQVGRTWPGSFLAHRVLIVSNVLHHKKVRAADRMLLRAFREMNDSGIDFRFLFLESYQGALEACVQRSRQSGSAAAEDLFRSVLGRKLHREVAAWDRDGFEATPESIDDLGISRALERRFEGRLGRPLPPGSIVFDSATTVDVGLGAPVILDGQECCFREALPLEANLLEKRSETVFGKHRLLASPDVAEPLGQLGEDVLRACVAEARR